MFLCELPKFRERRGKPHLKSLPKLSEVLMARITLIDREMIEDAVRIFLNFLRADQSARGHEPHSVDAGRKSGKGHRRERIVSEPVHFNPRCCRDSQQRTGGAGGRKLSCVSVIA